MCACRSCAQQKAHLRERASARLLLRSARLLQMSARVTISVKEDEWQTYTKLNYAIRRSIGSHRHRYHPTYSALGRGSRCSGRAARLGYVPEEPQVAPRQLHRDRFFPPETNSRSDASSADCRRSLATLSFLPIQTRLKTSSCLRRGPVVLWLRRALAATTTAPIPRLCSCTPLQPPLAESFPRFGLTDAGSGLQGLSLAAILRRTSFQSSTCATSRRCSRRLGDRFLEPASRRATVAFEIYCEDCDRPTRRNQKLPCSALTLSSSSFAKPAASAAGTCGRIRRRGDHRGKAAGAYSKATPICSPWRQITRQGMRASSCLKARSKRSGISSGLVTSRAAPAMDMFRTKQPILLSAN